MSLLRPVSDSQVRLRHLRASDLPVFAAYHADPDVARFQGFDPDTEAQAAVFSACQATATAQAAPGSWLQLAIAPGNFVRTSRALRRQVLRWHRAGRGRVWRAKPCTNCQPSYNGTGWWPSLTRATCPAWPSWRVPVCTGKVIFGKTAGTRASGVTNTSSRCLGPSGLRAGSTLLLKQC